MSTVPFTAYRTSFGMFVPCDRPTYRKLKRTRHLLCFAEAERRRWNRSQRRMMHNRAFKRHRNGVLSREAVDQFRMIFSPFYELRPADAALALPPDACLAHDTPLLSRFLDDHAAARHPKPDASDVRPPTLSAAEIDELLTQIELWNLQR